MAKELKLKAMLGGLEEEHFLLTREADDKREGDFAAARRIQSCWRSYWVRRNLKKLGKAAVVIEKSYRGHLGRTRCHLKAQQVAADARAKHFAYAATEIQRSWKGYFSRKFIHSFSARKAYLATVHQASEKLRAQLKVQYANQTEEEIMAQEQAMRTKFTDSIVGLHHLVSTEVTPGIYNSPFAAVTGGPPMVAGNPLEEHLRSARSGNTLLPPVHQGEKRFTASRASTRSVQAETPYSQGTAARRSFKTQDEVLIVDPKPFLAGGSFSLQNKAPVPTVRTGSPYGHHEMSEKLLARESVGKIKYFYTTTNKLETFEQA